MPVITISVGSKIALGVIAVIALGAGGLSIAAAADTLPDPIITESPAPTDDPIDDGIEDDDESDDEGDEGEEGEDGEDSDGVRGPDATGPAGYGLCTAYLAGGLRTVSTAYDSLSTAAGEGGIDAFCEVVIADKKGLSDEESDEESDDSDEKSGVTKGKSGVSETHGKPADKPAKPEKSDTSNKGGDKGGNKGGNSSSHGGGQGNGHNKH